MVIDILKALQGKRNNELWVCHELISIISNYSDELLLLLTTYRWSTAINVYQYIYFQTI